MVPSQSFLPVVLLKWMSMSTIEGLNEAFKICSKVVHFLSRENKVGFAPFVFWRRVPPSTQRAICWRHRNFVFVPAPWHHKSIASFWRCADGKSQKCALLFSFTLPGDDTFCHLVSTWVSFVVCVHFFLTVKTVPVFKAKSQQLRWQIFCRFLFFCLNNPWFGTLMCQRGGCCHSFGKTPSDKAHCCALLKATGLEASEERRCSKGESHFFVAVMQWAETSESEGHQRMSPHRRHCLTSSSIAAVCLTLFLLQWASLFLCC